MSEASRKKKKNVHGTPETKTLILTKIKIPFEKNAKK